jgi:molecular chaperone GrpE
MEDLAQQIEELKKQVEELKKQNEEYLNGWKRAKADLINFQRQMEREKAEWLQFSQADFLRAILPILDSLEQAVAYHQKKTNSLNPEIEHNQKKEEREDHSSEEEKETASQSLSQNEKEGLARIYHQMIETLRQMGVEEIKGIGEPPNPQWHEVIGREKSDEYQPGLIIKEVQKGYLLNGKVLRASKVIVSE